MFSEGLPEKILWLGKCAAAAPRAAKGQQAAGGAPVLHNPRSSWGGQREKCAHGRMEPKGCTDEALGSKQPEARATQGGDPRGQGQGPELHSQSAQGGRRD